MTTSRYCAECGTPFAASDRFCRDCGSARSVADPSEARGSARSRDTTGRPLGRAGTAGGATRYDQLGGSRAEARGEAVDYSDLASWGQRVGAFLLNTLVSALGSIPAIGLLISLAFLILTWILYRRGQDVGAKLAGIRVVRDTGELAGFFHMWSRGLAAILSALPLGAGYWTAFFDRNRQTWHDKIMRTYVVRNSPDLEDLPGTSSAGAVAWFWISLVVGLGFVVIVIAVAASLAGALV